MSRTEEILVKIEEKIDILTERVSAIESRINDIDLSFEQALGDMLEEDEDGL